MPLFEYQCDACGKRFEVIQKFSDPTPDACAKCGKGPVHRLQSSPAIQFKGTGWYVTDYAQKGKTGGDASSSDATDTKKADSGSSDTTAKSDSAAKADSGTKPDSGTKSGATPASASKPSSD